MLDVTTARGRMRALVLLAAMACGQGGCAAMTATFELSGTHWSDGGSWSEVKPLNPTAPPVGSVLFEPALPKLTCYRTPEARITSFSARYTTIYKILAGFMFISEGAISTAIFTSDNAGTGGHIAAGVVAADALATLALMIFTHTKIEKRDAPPPQYTVVAVCPPDTGVQIGDRFLAVDEHGSFRDAAAEASDALVADAPRSLRVAGRTVPVPLTESERAAKSPVLVVLERPSFVVPWPVETAPPPAPGTVATQAAPGQVTP